MESCWAHFGSILGPGGPLVLGSAIFSLINAFWLKWRTQSPKSKLSAAALLLFCVHHGCVLSWKLCRASFVRAADKHVGHADSSASVSVRHPFLFQRFRIGGGTPEVLWEATLIVLGGAPAPPRPFQTPPNLPHTVPKAFWGRLFRDYL